MISLSRVLSFLTLIGAPHVNDVSPTVYTVYRLEYGFFIALEVDR